jgi:glycosyltransferase involved in cell wall biosynthesis
MGHQVFLCAGDLGSAEGTLIEEMYHHLPEIERLNYNTLVALRDFDVDGYREELYRWVAVLEGKFRQFIVDKRINFLVPQNVWCVAANPAVAIALENVRREFDLPALAHNHDFYWERNLISLTCKPVLDLADKYLPPRDPKIKHAVINSLAQKELLARKGISSTVVPNVFDFDPPLWQQDDYNADFRQQIGLAENDLIILQATRVVPRKGIELAIDFVKALDEPGRRKILEEKGLFDGRQFNAESRIVLVLAGYSRDDMTGTYVPNLQQYAAEQGVDMIHIEDRIGHTRQDLGSLKQYSLWDSYVFADFVSYPSLWEGWGNQFLEAIRAKLPILIFEYPVYTADIKPTGFEVVSLGSNVSRYNPLGLAQVDQNLVAAAADQALILLTDADKRRQVVEHNFSLGQEYFSIDALRGYLGRLMEN